MPDIEQQITEWRNRMLAAGVEAPSPLDELENHLREDIEQLTRSGLRLQRAFDCAVERMGPEKAIQREFKKTEATRNILQQGLKALIGLALVAAIVGLNVLLKDELNTAFLIDVGIVSLVLPFMGTTLASKDGGKPNLRQRDIWAGQLLIAAGGLMIVVMPAQPFFGLSVALIACFAFGCRLRQQLHVSSSN